jgi:hypothetical protein
LASFLLDNNDYKTKTDFKTHKMEQFYKLIPLALADGELQPKMLFLSFQIFDLELINLVLSINWRLKNTIEDYILELMDYCKNKYNELTSVEKNHIT